MAYSAEEKYDMYNIYIKSNRDSTAAAVNYATTYPDRQQPHRTIFSRIAKALMSGSLSNPRKKYEKPPSANEINVLAQLYINPRQSSRAISSQCGISDSFARKIIKKYKYHDYKYTPVQKLYPGDPDRRLEFCQWFQDQTAADPLFCRKIIWSDESLFTNCGMFNRRNAHVYALENPHLIREVRNQYRFSVNVWCGILDTRIIGPYFIRGNLNAQAYLNLLENDLEEFLDDLPLESIRNLHWFQQDGSAVHNANMVTTYLNRRFPNSWIGTNGSIRWPPRSPCLNPLDYYLWGYLKNKVYDTPSESIVHLKQKIREEIAAIPPAVIRKAVDAQIYRTRLCIQKNGAQFEQYL